MSKTAQEMIDAWGAKRWPKFAGKRFSFEVDDTGSGCPTCGYTDIKAIVYADGKRVAEVEADIASILNEILEAA